MLYSEHCPKTFFYDRLFENRHCLCVWFTNMIYAIDINYNTLVEASDHISRYAPYVCPKCRKSVHFVSSVDKDNYQRIPHFAHHKGEGTIECENYCPPSKGNKAQHIGNYSPHPPVLKRKKPTYKFHIEIEVCEFNWSLMAVIHLTQFTGSVRIKEGYQGAVKESFEKKTQVKRIPLVPDTKYQIEISDKIQNATLEGLSEDQMNIFSVNNKRLVPKDKSLYWGEKYYFVWNEQLEIDIPKTLLGKECSTFNKWKCTEIIFPDQGQSLRSSLEQWVLDHLNKNMESLPEQEHVSLIFPPENCFFDNHSLLIGIYRDNTKKPIQGKITFINNGQTIESPTIEHASPVYIDTQMPNQSLVSITVNDTKYIIDKTDQLNKNSNYPSVFLITDRVRIEANDWKSTIENIDSHRFKEILLPAKMTVHMIIDKNETGGHQLSMKPQKSEHLDHFKLRLLEKVITSLEHANSTLELNFNNYGKIILLKQKIKGNVPLSKDIKRQVQWLSAMTWQQGWHRKKIPDSIDELKEFIESQKQMIRPEMEPYFRFFSKKE